MCGAAASSDATCCDHCGARLATVACPSCFGMMFIGQKFCPHCGARADRQDSAAEAAPEPCPHCKTMMDSVVIGGSHVRECPRCEGIWTDTETLRQICADRDQQASVLGMATHIPSNTVRELDKAIHYLPCPVCGDLMNRVNFANFSGIIVQVCRQHGTWFDRDELRLVVEFIRDGGMDKARAREIANLDEDRRMLEAKQFEAQLQHPTMYRRQDLQGAVSEVAQSIIDLFSR
jgi:Zn-finger nucleic acid-binding protein